MIEQYTLNIRIGMKVNVETEDVDINDVVVEILDENNEVCDLGDKQDEFIELAKGLMNQLTEIESV